MINSSASPSVALGATSTMQRPQCQALLQCAEQCCDPQPCERPATTRVSFRCASGQCDHASDLLLLCTVCTTQADAIGHVLAWRAL
jgi:hypothetical protein